MKKLLGGKGVDLTSIGVPAPPCFTITTEVCTYYNKKRISIQKKFRCQILKTMNNIEDIVGKKF